MKDKSNAKGSAIAPYLRHPLLLWGKPDRRGSSSPLVLRWVFSVKWFRRVSLKWADDCVLRAWRNHTTFNLAIHLRSNLLEITHEVVRKAQHMDQDLQAVQGPACGLKNWLPNGPCGFVQEDWERGCRPALLTGRPVALVWQRKVLPRGFAPVELVGLVLQLEAT